MTEKPTIEQFEPVAETATPARLSTPAGFDPIVRVGLAPIVHKG